MQQKTNAIFTDQEIEKLCKDLKELATEIINYEEKEMMPLTDKENNSYKKQKLCYTCKDSFLVMKMRK